MGKSRLRRSARGYAIYQSILRSLQLGGMSGALPFSSRYNALYGKEDMDFVMYEACMRSRNVTSVAADMNGTNVGQSGARVLPCDERMMQWMRAIDGRSLRELFIMDTGTYADRMKAMGLFNGPVDIAIDFHYRGRYDRRDGPELVRKKPQNGTDRFEGYATAQCVVSGEKLVLGVVPVRKLQSTPDFVPELIHICGRVGVEIGFVMMDREFFNTRVIRYLNENGIRFLIPCRNTDTVVDALGQYSRRSRHRVSELEIGEGGGGCTATYWAVITERRRRKKHAPYPEPPEEKYIAFATNVPDADPDRYRWRWNIETGYRLLEQGNAKTRCRAPAARMFCFMYTCLFYDAWIIARALMSKAYLLMGITNIPDLKWGEFAEALHNLLTDPTLEPKPPPGLQEGLFESHLR